MDSFMQMNEHRGDEMDELVNQLAREVSEINISSPIQPGPFLIESQPGAAQLRDRMNAGQTVRAERYRSRTDLRPALIRGRGLAAKCAKAGSQKRMGERRQNVSEYYGFESGLRGKQTLPRRISQGKFMKEEAERIKKEERRKAEKLKREFLRAEFSTKVLETGYVMANWYECLKKIELIRCAKGLESRLSSDEFAPVKQKLEAVEEYANVVDSVLWQSGWRIDFNTYRIVAINENDEEFARRRQAYLANSMLRFYLDMRRFKSINKNRGVVPNEYWEDPRKTRVEASLSMLEARYQIPVQGEHTVPIMRFFRRSVGKLGFVRPGDEIRASDEDVQRSGEHLAVKKRIGAIYYTFKERLEKKYESKEDIVEFLQLQSAIDMYVKEDCDDHENETESFRILIDRLEYIRKDSKNKCGKYAAILLGLLAKESSGYLEVPPDEICVVEDNRIGLENRISPFLSPNPVARKYKERLNRPLFTHRPNIRDIEQGQLGDCYLLAGLTAVVERNPEEIMKIMRDNGDGTVTVRFMRREVQADGRRSYVPHYVTVRKTIPVYVGNETDAFSRGAFWVKMMEKAYVASGLYLGMGREMNDRDYQAVKQYIDNVEPGVAYGDISGGNPGLFLSLLLGRDSEEHFYSENGLREFGDRVDGRRMLSIPAVTAEGIQIFKSDSADEIGAWYEKQKELFAYYKNSFRNGNGLPDESENSSYYDYFRSLGQLTIEQFNAFMDICKQQHLKQLYENQQITQREGNINTVQYYTAEQLDLYHRIQQKLYEGHDVTFITKDFGKAGTAMNGEPMSGGLVGQHVYTIINTRRERLGDREYLFLTLRNPWAYQGVVYHAEENGVRGKSDLLKEAKGLFYLELKDFAQALHVWYS